MNKNEAIHTINTNVFNKIRRKLTKFELLTVTNQLQNANMQKFTSDTINSISNMICEDIVRKAQSEQNFDMKEYLNYTLNDDKTTGRIGNCNREDKDRSIVNSINTNTNKIFGTNDPKQMLRIFNPSALTKKAYFILDRKYQSGIIDNKDFSWNLSYHNGTQNSIVTRAKLQNISAMRMYPFRLPDIPNALTFAKRLSIGIKEIQNQGFLVHNNNQFQFIFEIFQGLDGIINLKNISESITEHIFYENIQYFESLTINFSNPIVQLQLLPDRLPGVISANGVQTLITFNEVHLLNINDIISIENFKTTNQNDYIETTLMNNPNGWSISATTAFTITIDVDLSNLLGNIINPNHIYFESRRFLIPIELYYVNL